MKWEFFRIALTISTRYSQKSKTIEMDLKRTWDALSSWIFLPGINISAYDLNCPCHLHGSIHIRMHNWVPLYLVKLKVYIDMDNLFLFQFWLRNLFVKNEDAPCFARPIHRKGALALGQFQLAENGWACLGVYVNIRSKFQITKIQISKKSVIAW